MKCLKKSLLAGMLTTMLTTLLLTAGGARAVTPGCGTWSVVTSPSPGQNNNNLYAVAALSANNVWAVGDYVNSRGDFRTLTEHWNGTNWSVVPSPNVGVGGNSLTGVAAISSTHVWAVGASNTFRTSVPKTLIEHWDGTTWSVVSSPNVGKGINGLGSVAAVSASDLWAVGAYFNNHTGVEESLVEHWNGAKWSVVTNPNVGANYNGLGSVAAISATNVWAVGSYSSDGGLTVQTLIEQWNGTSWSVVPSPNAGSVFNFLQGVAAVSATNIWTVGQLTNNGAFRTFIEHWNGTKWSVVPSPNDGRAENDLYSVAAISATNVWAVGYYINYNSGYFRTLAEQWNGTKRIVVKSPSPGSEFDQLHGVTAVANTLWSVGYTAKNGNQQKTLTEFYC
jgi:hypothetical protein